MINEKILIKNQYGLKNIVENKKDEKESTIIKEVEDFQKHQQDEAERKEIKLREILNKINKMKYDMHKKNITEQSLLTIIAKLKAGK